MIVGLIDETVKRYVPPESVEEQWDIPGLETALAAEFQMQAPVGEWLKDDPEITDETAARPPRPRPRSRSTRARRAQVGPELMRQFERSLMLQTLDQHWRDHLANLDHLRQGIHLRGYAQKNPKQEYKRESFELFSDMLDRIKQDVVKIVLTVQVRTQEDVQAVEEAPAVTNVQYQHADYDEALAAPHREDDDAARRRAGAARAVRARRREGRPQRSVSLRLGQEIQAVSRAARLKLQAPELRRRAHRVEPVAARRLTRRARRPHRRDHRRVRRCPSATRRRVPRTCCRFPGVTLGTAAAKIKNWQRDDVLLVAFDEARSPPACSRRTASAPRR